VSRKARAVALSPSQHSILSALSRSRVLAQRLVERATMIILSAASISDSEQARRLGVDEQRPRRWRARWLARAAALDEAERGGATESELRERIQGVLADAPRPGTPAKFSPEQIAQLISLACEPPSDSGLPVTHWTPEELAKEARKRGIVESISARHLDRLLKRGRSATA
jgi:putative transposase